MFLSNVVTLRVEHCHLTSHPSICVKRSLDRIERDEEMYLEQLRASSLAYRAPPPLLETGGNGEQQQNSGCYPVVGVSSSSKLMSDILLQFHQEAESIDLLGVNAIQGSDSNTPENSNGDSFFHKHQSLFQELFLRHQQAHRTGDHDTDVNTSPFSRNAVLPLSHSSMAEKDGSSSRNIEGGDVSHSSSMMMMSMNSSATTLMSP